MYKSPFWVALMTSLVVAILSYFVLFAVLRTDIVDTKSLIASTIQEHDALLKKTFDSQLSSFQEALIQNIGTATESVVSILASSDVQLYMTSPTNDLSAAESTRQLGGGSGIIVSKSGYIITNKHVVSDTNVSYTIITYDGKAYPVKNIWTDPTLDIAVVIVDDSGFTDHLTEASFVSRGEPVRIGQFVFAIGNALTQRENTVTFGVVSAKNRTLRIQGNNIYAGLLQTDTAINPGNSGGPLLDIYGNVIAITTAMSQFGQGISFALPVSYEFIQATVQSIIADSQIIRPSIGIVYTDITPEIQKNLGISQISNGIYVTDVFMDSVAFVAGVQKGDIIISLDDMPIDDTMPFLYQLYTYMPGDTIRLQIIRSGDSIHRDLVLLGNL